jgi:hypothetical protein
VTELAAKAKQLYERFLAPLVLGGELTPGPALGARAAMALDGGLAAVDPDVRSRVDVARVRVARRLVPVDTLEGPSADEWALAAALHDLVHALHPDLGGFPHASAPEKLLDLTRQTLEAVPPAATLAEELSRHTYFARLFEIERTDTRVSWWSGSRVFVGTAPSPRLLAWPELRRVHTEETTYALVELPNDAASARRRRFWEELDRLLVKLPLTDLATSARGIPAFAWNGANLGLFATPHTRVVAFRALALQPTWWVDAALARATAAHVKAEAWENVARIADVLGERALVMASTEATRAAGPEPDATLESHAAYAQAFGAVVAMERVESLGMSEEGKRAVMGRLLPLVQSGLGREVRGIVGKLG